MGYIDRKPVYSYIDADNIHDKIIDCISKTAVNMGYDLTDPKQRKTITHNEINYILRQVYNELFKPDNALYNNQKSLLNYDDVNTLRLLADTFIDISSMFNKSLGIMSFSYMIGVSHTTLYEWANNPESNPARSEVIKYIQASHKLAQISLLNDTPVGAMAVANNDHETGLDWSKNNLQQLASNAVYLIPSERNDRLKLDKLEND